MLIVATARVAGRKGGGHGRKRPLAGIPLHNTDGFHDRARGCREPARCFWPVVCDGTAIGSLALDLPATMRFAAEAPGRDPALDAALADIAAFERR